MNNFLRKLWKGLFRKTIILCWLITKSRRTDGGLLLFVTQGSTVEKKVTREPGMVQTLVSQLLRRPKARGLKVGQPSKILTLDSK